MTTAIATEKTGEAPYQQAFAAVIASLQTGAEGLTDTEAASRLTRNGRNELAAKAPVPAWRRFLAQFADVLVILLLVATGISFGLWLLERESPLPYEAMAILAVVIANAVMGYVQEARAEKSVAALRKMIAAQANVLRGGARKSVPSAEIVTGDVLLLEEGDTVPADARLIESTSLQIAEATLTGESVPVEKSTDTVAANAELADRHNMIYSGTSATYGRGAAVVTATGMNTEMGRIATLLENAPDEITPLQKELDQLGKRLGVIVVIIAVVMIATIIVIEKVQGVSALLEVLILGVALAVAAVPEGLPAVVTTVLSLGVQRMAKRNAIVRHLSAVETLGSATIIASDKTGTLTKNEMTVRAVVTASGRGNVDGTGYAPTGSITGENGASPQGAFLAETTRTLTVADRAGNAVLQEASGVWTVQGDPTEGALIVAARKAGLEKSVLEKRFVRVAEVPFSSERKLMSAVFTDADRQNARFVFVKGAPDVLLNRCTHELVGAESVPLTDDRRAAIGAASDALAGEALRTLGVAERAFPEGAPTEGVNADIENGLTFLGVVGMIDPPRTEAKDAVARARGAGIRPVMITGDHPQTATVIAAELGIVAKDGRVLTGAEIEAMSNDALAQAVHDVSVYARVSPQHKLRIVTALRSGGAIVAMTGDGVNDAPALKTADIGIAMGITGTDVSKEAADVILTDDNFATIVAAVEEGRAIFDNIRRFLRFLLSSNIGEVLTMFFGVLLAKVIGLDAPGESGAVILPLLATQILWVNLVTDGAPALALGVDRAESGLMVRVPRPTGESVVTARMWAGVVFVGAIMATGTLLVLDASLPGGVIAGSVTASGAAGIGGTDRRPVPARC
ncbi:MAG: cation-translocating P-type ATPase [Armatimonadetes bacterium]|nr:cation-translocating P-type ATPase [Armatimonadota bacterium]